MSGDGLRAPVNAPPALGAPVGVSSGGASPIVRARRVIVSGEDEGVFSYSGSPPAFGNLIGTTGLNASTTDDGLGNATLPGTTDYFDTGLGFVTAVSIFSGIVAWYQAATEAGPYTLAASVGFQFSGAQGGLVLGDTGLGVKLNSTAPSATPVATPSATAASIILAGRAAGIWL
jgi:hypothetical protein